VDRLDRRDRLLDPLVEDGFAAETTVTGSESIDRLHVNGQGGDDSARIGQGVSALIGVTLDLG